jgi:hypothetical protein
MRQFLGIMLAVSCAAVFAAPSVALGADDEKKQQGDESKDIVIVAEEIDVRYHLKALEAYVNDLEKTEEADRRTNPKYAEEVGYLETRRRLMKATVEDFEMGRASTDDYRRASEKLAELELQSNRHHEDRVKASKAHLERMTELAKIVKARMDAGTTGEREMLEGKAAQENAERQLRMLQQHETHSAAEVTIKQRAAEPFAQHYRKVSALFEASAKGGEAETHASAGREHYLAQAEIAMARGQPMEALSALKAAAVLADRALVATQAAYEVGTLRSSDVIDAAKARSHAFRRYSEMFRVFGDPKQPVELPDDPFFASVGVKQAAR